MVHLVDDGMASVTCILFLYNIDIQTDIQVNGTLNSLIVSSSFEIFFHEISTI